MDQWIRESAKDVKTTLELLGSLLTEAKRMLPTRQRRMPHCCIGDFEFIQRWYKLI